VAGGGRQTSPYAIFNRSVRASLVVDKFRNILLEAYGVSGRQVRDGRNLNQDDP
jgi:hypothetical protein